jgi:hypothetical protein
MAMSRTTELHCEIEVQQKRACGSIEKVCLTGSCTQQIMGCRVVCREKGKWAQDQSKDDESLLDHARMLLRLWSCREKSRKKQKTPD